MPGEQKQVKMLAVILAYYEKGMEAINKGVPMVKIRKLPGSDILSRRRCPITFQFGLSTLQLPRWHDSQTGTQATRKLNPAKSSTGEDVRTTGSDHASIGWVG